MKGFRIVRLPVIRRTTMSYKVLAEALSGWRCDRSKELGKKASSESSPVSSKDYLDCHRAPFQRISIYIAVAGVAYSSKSMIFFMGKILDGFSFKINYERE